MEPQSTPRSVLTAYSAPNFALAIMHIPVGLVIPALYAQHTTLSLAAVGSILLFGRIFDAVSDPLIGYYSDRTRSSWGKRKPWMIAGTPIAMVAIIFLFTPPETAGSLYFLCWSVLLFASWTLIDIPYAAWGFELSLDYDERSRIMTWRNVAGYIGNILFVTSPLLLSPWTKSTQIGPEVMGVAAWTVALTLPVLMILAVKTVPAGVETSIRRVDLKDFIRSAKINKPFHRYMIAMFAGGIGNGAWLATVMIYTDTYMGIGDKFAYLLLVAWVTRILASPVWLRLICRFSKHKAWAYGCFLSAVITPMALLIPPGPSSLVPILVYALVLGFVETPMLIAPYTIFGDIVDYDTLKTGSNKASSYYALYGLILKAISGIGGGVAFFFLSALDFNVKGGNSFSQNIGLFCAFAVVPALMYVVTGLIMNNFPLNKHRQEIVKRRIESLALRAKNKIDKKGFADDPGQN